MLAAAPFLLLAVQVSSFPWYYGNEPQEEGATGNYFKGVDCGVIPEVDQKLGRHQPVEAEADPFATLFTISADGEELSGCYNPGAEHIIEIKFPDPRHALIYIEGGEFVSEQEDLSVELPSDCDNTRRTLGRGKFHELTYAADDSGDGLVIKLVSSVGVKFPHFVLTQKVDPCGGGGAAAADADAAVADEEAEESGLEMVEAAVPTEGPAEAEEAVATEPAAEGPVLEDEEESDAEDPAAPPSGAASFAWSAMVAVPVAVMAAALA